MMVELDSQYMHSCSGLIVPHCLTRFSCKLQSLQNLNDPDVDLSRSLNVNFNIAVDFLLVSISHGLAVIGTDLKIVSFGQNFGQLTQNDSLFSGCPSC